MQLTIFAVRDSAAGIYMRPFYLTSAGAAIRSFHDEVNRSAADNSLFHHPEDFELFEFGTWDDNTGQFELYKVPKSIGTAKQFKVSTAA